MSRIKTERPAKLAERLLRIRGKLELSQTEMAEALKQYDVTMHRGYISFYENDVRVPDIFVAYAYARVAKISLDLIIDDKRDLPNGF